MKDTDIEPLVGRTLAFWPINDEKGTENGLILRRMFPNCRVVVPPDDMPAGWDLASAKRDEWPREDVMGYLVADIIPPDDESPPDGEVEPTDGEQEANPEEYLTAQPMPFRCLGFFGNPIEFFFITTAFGQVQSFSAQELTEANLTTMARPAYWNARYPSLTAKGKPTGATNWGKARSDLIWKSHEAGMFDPDSVRGRGCWLEGSDVVIHTGSYLIRNGQELPLQSSACVYERALPLEETFGGRSLKSSESVALKNLCEMMRFRDNISGLFLAGWLYNSTICGVFHWRSHLWLNGGHGVGKSTITTMANALCGKHALKFKGGTTEAYIRQKMGSDARPCIGDDIESDNEKNMVINEGIINLMRQSSTDSDACTGKGTADQKGLEFRTRSAFFLNSISMPYLEAADKSRITTIEKLVSSDDDFAKIEALAAQTVFDAEWCAALRKRARENAAKIAENAKVFAKACSLRLGTRRAGDQLGTMIAGAYGLTTTDLVTLEKATSWVEEQDWSISEQNKPENEEQACLRTILDYQLPYPSIPVVHISIRELISRFSRLLKSSTDYDLISELLARNGLFWKDGWLTVRVKHPTLSKAFRQSRWADGSWGQCLARLPAPPNEPAGSRVTTHYCGAGGSNRAVKVSCVPEKQED
jgi:putative DNA primase/helicase